MAKKKEDKEKITVTCFKDKSSNYWVCGKHYTLTKDNEVILAAGGLEIDAETEYLKAYIKRNKKIYTPREIVSQIEYNETINFGKYSGKSVSEIKDLDKKYLIWLRDSYSFKGEEEKLKQEIINILK